MKLLWPIILTYALACTTVQAQKLENKKHKIGFLYGYGGQNEMGLETSYYYEVNFFQFQYYYLLLNMKDIDIEVAMQPQINSTRFRPLDSETYIVHGFEYGLNLGCLIRKNYAQDAISLYMLISSGPHYVSGTPERQSSGFIFSDNIFLGISIKMLRTTSIDIRPGFRHLSNAGRKRPNGGVNNFVINVGLMMQI